MNHNILIINCNTKYIKYTLHFSNFYFLCWHSFWIIIIIIIIYLIPISLSLNLSGICVFPGLLSPLQFPLLYFNQLRIWFVATVQSYVSVLSALEAVPRARLLGEFRLGRVRHRLLRPGLGFGPELLALFGRGLSAADGGFERRHLSLQLGQLLLQLVYVAGVGFVCSDWQVHVTSGIIF